jgi:hypothetical protein
MEAPMDHQADDAGTWHVVTTVRKYVEDATPWRDAGRMSEFERLHTPYEEVVVDGNILVTAGIGLMLDLLIGAGGTVFNNTNAKIGVGDSTTAAAIGQTDLVAATNKLRKGMDGGFPSRATNVLSFQATFTTAEANFAWNEWAVFNAAAAGTMLNRKVEALGTKATGSWVLGVTITIT